MSDSVWPSPLSAVVSAVVTAATLGVAFGLLALGVESFWLAFVVGFGVVLPAAVGLVESDWSSDTRQETADRDGEAEAALATLRQRYARGELSEAEFERRVERLLETTAVPAKRTRETAHRVDEKRSEVPSWPGDQ
ncbi:MAG: SHOCT domain-containing protein [Haloarcula sp.]